MLKNDANVKSIEGEFDTKGQLQGPAKIDYFDSSRIFGHFVDGVLHGVARWAILLIFGSIPLSLNNVL